jgi:hypothetical protein
MEIAKQISITYYRKTQMVEALSNKSFMLLENASTKWINNGKEYRISLRTGFTWDGATIPRFLWSILGYYPGGIMTIPSKWHDEIYRKKGWIFNFMTAQEEYISRKHCDDLFYAHMIRSGVEEKKAKQMYLAVRFFGRFFWADKTDWWIFRVMPKFKLSKQKI